MLAVAYQYEANMHNIDMAIAGTEYMALRETGQEMVWEADGIKGIITKAKDGINWIWKQNQKFFKTVMNKYDLMKTKGFLDKYRSKAAGKFGIVQSDIKLNCKNIEETSKSNIKNIIPDKSKDCGLFDGLMNLVKNYGTVYDIILHESTLVYKTYIIFDDKLIDKDAGKLNLQYADAKKLPREKYLKMRLDKLSANSSKYSEKDATSPAVISKVFEEEYLYTKKPDNNKVCVYTVKGEDACDVLAYLCVYKHHFKDTYNKSKDIFKQIIESCEKSADSLKLATQHDPDSDFQKQFSETLHTAFEVMNTIGSWLTLANRVIFNICDKFISIAKKATIACASGSPLE